MARVKKKRTRKQWLQLVEREIGKSATGKKVRVTTKDGTGMHSVNDLSWLLAVINEVEKSHPKGMYDQNMFMARRLGSVLLTWAFRVGRAKCFDPARPVRLRKKSYANWNNYLSGLIASLTDDRDDPLVWAGQEWDNPYGKKAKNGKFV